MKWTTLKRLLLLFWAVWLSLVVVFNLADALKAFGVLPASFVWASGNYSAIAEVLEPFGLPEAAAGVMLAGVIVWEAVCAGLYWSSGLTYAVIRQDRTRRLVVLTFAASLGLWAGFQIACEVFPSELAYRLGGTHRLLFTETLATLLAVVLLPDE